jgi:hypothetical protein
MADRSSALEEKIEAVLGRPVDLVTEAALSPYIRESALEDLVVIYECAAFEACDRGGSFKRRG